MSKRSFYQDRLGTNVGETQKESDAFSYRHHHLERSRLLLLAAAVAAAAAADLELLAWLAVVAPLRSVKPGRRCRCLGNAFSRRITFRMKTIHDLPRQASDIQT
jgi:hypothetical protein